MSDRAEYFCGITGPIGVGKSSAYSIITQYLLSKHGGKVVKIPEYIDGRDKEVAHLLLQMYLDGKLSDASFQNYIQSYYNNAFVGKEAGTINGKIVIMERCMSDSIVIFSNLANRKGNLDNLNLAIMLDNCIAIDENVGAPNYFKKNFEFSRIKTETIEQTSEEIKRIIDNDLRTGVKNRVIGLYNTAEECFDRMTRRNRDGESSYTFQSIKNNCDMYMNLYDMIEDPERKEILMTDFGQLFHPRE